MTESTTTTTIFQIEEDAFANFLEEYVRDHNTDVAVETGRSSDETLAELEAVGDRNIVILSSQAHEPGDRGLRIQNEQLEELVASISHDLRNPLAVVKGRMEMARETGDLSHLDSAEEALTRANELLDHLRVLTEEGKLIREPEAVELREVAETAWGVVETGEATLTLEASEPVVADPQRLRQLFGNLFYNAVEHGGSDVEVTVGLLEEEVGFFVSDDGQGIAEAELAEVFEPGYSGDADGSGLGLAICKQIAGAHGWDIEAVYARDGGTRIEVSGVEVADSTWCG